MKIEVWSDYVCPFCYIGKRRLEQALQTFPQKDKVEVTFKSFELQPHLPSDPNVSVHEMLAKKMGATIEQAKSMNEQVIQSAASVGLAYNFDSMKQVNTLDAHRLVKFAEQRGKAAELTERLLSAHFIESQFLGANETLISLAEEVGLDRDEVQQVLSSNAHLEEVRQDQVEGQQLGVQGVPFFVFNRKYAISGAQPLEVFTQTLTKVWEEENGATPLQQVQSTTGATCTDDGCEIPEK
ncbi:DsbA family oxidoreductase [Sutcliffiella cohnii]|uniref:DsbA family oxidoreductase n=1 Tax=Sutcliffiella cohnii TaxID=33932 RepID=UPI002E1F04D7|nr:DsbA family oxidoreductase [Sutcliffiella cohnii]